MTFLGILNFDNESVSLKPITKRSVELLNSINNLIQKELDSLKTQLKDCIEDGDFIVETFYETFIKLKKATV